MRLTGGSDDEPLTQAWAYLTAAEAIDLFHALSFYFEDAQPDTGWHHHVGDGDGPELTIAIDNPHH